MWGVYPEATVVFANLSTYPPVIGDEVKKVLERFVILMYDKSSTATDIDSVRLFIIINSVLRPFQDYFSSYEKGQSVGGRKREYPEKKHLAHPQAERLVSHVTSAGLEPTPDTSVR